MKVRDVAKCHQNAIPIWAEWVKGKVVGVVLRRINDPTYAHVCCGILVLSSQMEWQQAMENICRYMGCDERILPRYPLRGAIFADIILLRRICEAVGEAARP